jgi:catechol 2,3-dioxygenase-like lactoylglutathione lyase family enzyme
MDGMTGFPLSYAVIRSARIDVSVRFYRDELGFKLLSEGEVNDVGFAKLWQLPHDTVVHVAILEACGSAVGRILLLQIDGIEAQYARAPTDRMTQGLLNLNFYVKDLRTRARAFMAAGYEFWSEPVDYKLDGGAGGAIDVLFEGPDSVVINLIEPEGETGTETAATRTRADALGRTEQGFTPIATSAIVVTAIDASQKFYQQVLGFDAKIDAIFGGGPTNQVLCLPDEAKSRLVFMAADHVFGKIALIQPLNFSIPDRIDRALRRSIGYLAQAFTIDDLSYRFAVAKNVGASIWSEATAFSIPGLSGRGAIVRIPGSGALAWLIKES